MIFFVPLFFLFITFYFLAIFFLALFILFFSLYSLFLIFIFRSSRAHSLFILTLHQVWSMNILFFLFFCLHFWLDIYLSICLSIYLSVSLSLSLFTFSFNEKMLFIHLIEMFSLKTKTEINLYINLSSRLFYICIYIESPSSRPSSPNLVYFLFCHINSVSTSSLFSFRLKSSKSSLALFKYQCWTYIAPLFSRFGR